MDTKIIRFANHHHTRRAAWLLTAAAAFATGLVLAYTFWTRAPRIVRGVYIAGISVSGLTEKQAREKITKNLPPLGDSSVTVGHEDKLWATSSSALGLHRNYDAALTEALLLGRRSTILTQQSLERAQLLAQPRDIPIPLQYEEPPVRAWVASLAKNLNIPGRAPSVKLTNTSYLIDSGLSGQRLNEEELVHTLLAEPAKLEVFPAPVEPTVIALSADGLILAENRFKRLRPAEIILKAADNEPKITVDAPIFFPWINLPDGWDTAKIDAYVDELADRLDRPAVDAEFERDSQNERKLKKFQPQRDGRELARDELVLALIETLRKIEQGKIEPKQEITIPFRVLAANNTLESLNDLGIKERLGVGNSTFFHSIPNRVSNVALTSQRLHATLVAPGEDFSFNRAIGEVSKRTGFKPAYVISGGRTVLGDGGGVCQVSTTTFRAILSAGLPIGKWKAHSYRVGYYEQNYQPGFDATVSAPSPDLTFTNDTGYYVVIATAVDIENRFLSIEIWGTSDGRKAEISNYSLTNQTGAPAPAYIPDPTLPKGTTKQVDWSAPGAKAQFTYIVVDQDGQQTFQRTFVSQFQAWRAVFLVGTQ